MSGWNKSVARHWLVAQDLAIIIMGKDRANADPLALAEATSLLHAYKSNPYFIKSWCGDYGFPHYQSGHSNRSKGRETK